MGARPENLASARSLTFRSSLQLPRAHDGFTATVVSLTGGGARMPTQQQMIAALDLALNAQVTLLFSKMASAGSGPDPEGRFAEGIKNAASFYDKAVEIIKNVVPGTASAARAQPSRGSRRARPS